MTTSNNDVTINFESRKNSGKWVFLWHWTNRDRFFNSCATIRSHEKKKKKTKQTNKHFCLKRLIINDTFIGWFIKFSYYTDGIDIISEQLRRDTNCQLKFIKNFWIGFIKEIKITDITYTYHSHSQDINVIRFAFTCQVAFLVKTNNCCLNDTRLFKRNVHSN